VLRRRPFVAFLLKDFWTVRAYPRVWAEQDGIPTQTGKKLSLLVYSTDEHFLHKAQNAGDVYAFCHSRYFIATNITFNHPSATGFVRLHLISGGRDRFTRADGGAAVA